jgi:hypothetical protein
MKRFAVLLLVLAGCAGRESGVYPTAAEFQARHPTWSAETCEKMAAGKIWLGMTERQFLHQMRRGDREIEWQVTTTTTSRVYRRAGSRQVYVVDLHTQQLSDWVWVE